MFSRTLLILILFPVFAGCADQPDPAVNRPEHPIGRGFELGGEQGGRNESLRSVADGALDALDLIGIANVRATSWNPDAELHLISTFEGPVAFQANRWSAPYSGAPDRFADGLSLAWSFSFKVSNQALTPPETLCSNGIHAQIRESLVVTVNHDGEILEEYTTMDDDEGAPATQILEAPRWNSSSAGSVVWTHSDVYRASVNATWAQAYLVRDWYREGPQWVFVLRYEDRSPYHMYVDARSGTLFYEGPPQEPLC